ncbi:MAG: hypothetical protein MK041_11835 [Aquabacterium sp.]|nr:hypothetical protein [Aquabacterium sp.]
MAGTRAASERLGCTARVILSPVKHAAGFAAASALPRAAGMTAAVALVLVLVPTAAIAAIAVAPEQGAAAVGRPATVADGSMKDATLRTERRSGH